MQAEREYMQLATSNMTRRLELMEEVSAQNSCAAHDRRHFNNVILNLLEQEKVGEVLELLRSQNQTVPKISRVYCENHAINGAVCHYASLAEHAGILTELEMENPCAHYITLDENGYPIAKEEGHGIGSKSVMAFVKKYDGELLYKIENGVFRVRLLV